MSPYLETAIAAARAAEVTIRKHYTGGFDVRLKADRSPVTAADVEAEKVIKKIVLDAFPEHGFYGEETGRTCPDAEYTWLIDPVDGTKSFVRGYPFFSTQIALLRGDEWLLGVSNAPLFEELAYAERGTGAYLNGRALQVSGIGSLEQATLSLGNIKTLAGGNHWSRVAGIVQAVDRIRGYGDFYHYHLLASGKIDIVLESDVHILDVAALGLIVSEAGGVFTDLEGRPLSLHTNSVLAASDRCLHDAVLRTLHSDSWPISAADRGDRAGTEFD